MGSAPPVHRDQRLDMAKCSERRCRRTRSAGDRRRQVGRVEHGHVAARAPRPARHVAGTAKSTTARSSNARRAASRTLMTIGDRCVTESHVLRASAMVEATREEVPSPCPSCGSRPNAAQGSVTVLCQYPGACRLSVHRERTLDDDLPIVAAGRGRLIWPQCGNVVGPKQTAAPKDRPRRRRSRSARDAAAWVGGA